MNELPKAARIYVAAVIAAGALTVDPRDMRVFLRGVPVALQVTFYELAIAFVLSVVIGMVVGLAVGLSKFSHRSFMPIILLLYGTPQITILPLFILYFGIGPPSKIAFGVSHGIFPIIVTIVAGVQNIDPSLLKAARSMGASEAQILTAVIVPTMLPSFFTGMRLGLIGVDRCGQAEEHGPIAATAPPTRDVRESEALVVHPVHSVELLWNEDMTDSAP